jgi:tRNA nucleotidyltransferase (CCA-adding enzyme)
MEEIVTREGIGRLPVVEAGRVTGVVTRTDLLKARYGHSYAHTRRTASRKPEETESAHRLRERMPAPLQRVLATVGEVAQQQGGAAFLVGGVVRDLLLGVPNADVDVLAEPDAIALVRAVAATLGDRAVVKIEPRFGTARLTWDEFSVDFATARTETYAHPGALPDVEPSSLKDDLRRRDFTINAMALSLSPERFGVLVDPFGGWVDLERRRLRILPNTLSFVEDPTRLFRAVRFEERLRFRMDEHTEELARHAIASEALAAISPERLRAELHRTFAEARPLGALLRLEELGVLAWLHPDLQLNPALLAAVPSALEWWDDHAQGVPVARAVYLAALLATLPTDTARMVAEERLRLPPPDAERLREMLSALSRTDLLPSVGERPAEITRRLRPLGAETLALLRAYAAAKQIEPKRRGLLDRYITEWRQSKLEITGDDLKALGYPAGPALGRALRATLDAHLNGDVRGREPELAYARAWLDEH